MAKNIVKYQEDWGSLIFSPNLNIFNQKLNNSRIMHGINQKCPQYIKFNQKSVLTAKIERN